ncbi:MAG: hypothetical protein RR231_09245 [Acinetobacter sp.]
MSHSYWAYSGYYRIADKQEIAAGNRINLTSVSPTSDTIEDSDIEYHVSPLCKIEVK